MHKDKSLLVIKGMSANDRWQLARKKLDDSTNACVVDTLLQHLRARENTRWLVYNSRLPKQIPRSHAAHAFVELQRSVFNHEIVRLCTFWDPVDLDSRNIPTIVALSDCPGVSQCVDDDHFAMYQSDDLAFSKEYGKKARRLLRTAIRGAKEVKESSVLRTTRNLRDKLAHQLEQTREEKTAPVPVLRHGDERKLLAQTVTTVNRLYMSLNGTGFDWKGAKAMYRRDADAFWMGVTIKVKS